MTKGYHPANLPNQPYPHWRVIVLAKIACLLGVQFKINGIPFGGKYRADLWDNFHRVSMDVPGH